MRTSKVSAVRVLTAAAVCGMCAFSMGYTVQTRTMRNDDIKLSGCLIRA